jgi:DNA/RNA endonuclease G (NUC1)
MASHQRRAQRSLLNQGKQLWQGLENYILNSARKQIECPRTTGAVVPIEDTANPML